MKSCFFLSASLLVACSVKAQVIFQKTYGGHQYENSDCMYRGPGSITRTAEGGYAICHATASYGVPASTSGESLYFLKIDDNGDTLVTRAYNSGGNSIGRSIFEAAGGGYVMGATMGGAAGTSLIRVNANGDTLWTRSFSPIPGGFGGTGYYGFPFNDGGFGAVGEYGETVQNHSTFCAGLAKVDANGNLVFGKTYYYNPALFNGTGMRFYSASPTSDGGVLATGYIDDMEIDVVVVRMDSTGNVLWAKSYDLSTEEAGLMAKELPDHSIAVTGYVALSTTDWNSFLMKTDSSGNMIWAHMYGDTLYQWSNSFVNDASGDFILTGNHQNTPSPFTSHAYLLCVDSTGAIKWGNQYGGSSTDLGCSLTNASDGGYMMLGITQSFGAGSYDLYGVKTDAVGNAGCYTYPLPFTAYALPFTVSPVTIGTAQPLYASPFSMTIDHGAIVSTLCTNVGVEEKTGAGFSLFPDPANDEVQFIPGVTGRIVAKIFSVTGAEVKCVSMEAMNSRLPLNIPVAELPDGIYFLQLQTANGISTQRFIVQH